MKLTTWIRNHVSSSRTSEFWTRKKETIFLLRLLQLLNNIKTTHHQDVFWLLVLSNKTQVQILSRHRGGKEERRGDRGEGASRGAKTSNLRLEKRVTHSPWQRKNLREPGKEPPAHKIPEPTTIWLLLRSMLMMMMMTIRKLPFPWVVFFGTKSGNPFFYSMLVSLPESALLVFVKLGLIVWKNRAKGLKSRLYHMWCIGRARFFREIRSNPTFFVIKHHLWY